MARDFNRREFLAGLAGAGVALSVPRLRAQSLTPGLLKPAFISHMGVTVSDLKTSAAFYQKLFGFTPLETTTPASLRTFGFYFGPERDRFISLHPTPREKAGRINHYCIACESFDPEKDGKRLMDAGFEGVRIDTSEADQWVLLQDPDKNFVQLLDTKYTAHCPTCAPPPDGASMPPPEKCLLSPRQIAHISVTVADLKRARDFYQKLFVLPREMRTLAPPSIPSFALDFNGQFISLTLTTDDVNAPGRGVIAQKPGVIDHFCIAVDNFDSARDAQRLKDAGMDVRISTNNEDRLESIMVTDPDGLPIQISG